MYIHAVSVSLFSIFEGMSAVYVVFPECTISFHYHTVKANKLFDLTNQV